MRKMRRLTVIPAIAMAFGIVSIGVSGGAALAQEKELALRGLVDCGASSETTCGDVSQKGFFLWTTEFGPDTSHVKVDVSWIKPERLPYLDQEDELCLTGFVRDDQVYQATSVNEQCDEGTVNDKEEEQERKDERKERNR